MDLDDVARRVIGLLTAAHTIDHEGGTRADFGALIKPLLGDMLDMSFDMKISDTGDIHAIAQAAAYRTLEGVKPTLIEMLATFLSAFMILCRHYEADYPDADISGILQKMALSI